jgi:hypothetical protein
MLSIILGGFLYFLKVSNINYLFSLFLCPMAFILYWYQTKIQKVKYQNYYEVSIYFYNHRHLNVTGYLDTGNQLVDPITNKPVILIDRRLTKGVIQIRTPIYVYYNALNCHNVLECIKPSYVLINNKKYKNVLIGFMNNKISMDGIDCILNPIMMEE